MVVLVLTCEEIQISAVPFISALLTWPWALLAPWACGVLLRPPTTVINKHIHTQTNTAHSWYTLTQTCTTITNKYVIVFGYFGIFLTPNENDSVLDVFNCYWWCCQCCCCVAVSPLNFFKNCNRKSIWDSSVADHSQRWKYKHILNDLYTGDSTPNINVTMATNSIIFEMTNFQYCPSVSLLLAEVWPSWLPAWCLAFGLWFPLPKWPTGRCGDLAPC